MKPINIPKNCDDSPNVRDGPTANLASFGLPKSVGSIVGHMAFALIGERAGNPQFTQDWEIKGTGKKVIAKPGFNFWINVLPGMSPGLGVMSNWFLYEGEINL